jgi:hypothetical protein
MSTGKSFLFILLSLVWAFSAHAGPIRILDGAQIKNGAATVVIPTTSTDLVGHDTTQTLTNKSLSGASNTFTAIPLATAVSGQLPVANGGTGATTQAGAANAVLPSQSGNSGEYLTTDGTDVSWAPVPSTMPNITGTRAAPTAVTAAGGIAFSGSAYKNVAFIEGDGAAINITADPQIAAGSSVGQELMLIGRSATNTVTIEDGNGLSLNGAAVLGLDSVIELVWDGSAWVETARR